MEKAEHRSVTIIIPTLNEGKNIARVIRELKHLGFSNLLVIDGNSNDETVKIAEELGVTVIRQNGKGKGEALRQAFGYNGLNGNLVVIMDADGSMNPKEVFSFVKALEYGADLVKGSRFMPGGNSEDMTLIRRIGNSLFVLLTNLMCSTNYTDLCYGFAAFKRDAIERLYPYLQSKNFEIEAEIFIKAKKIGLKIVEVPSIELRRVYGKSNLRAYKDGFRILKVILHEAFRGIN
ncbi:glycosyltransferase [Candidatus Bathyarchaeota archaeon]|nr:glycosyltransferase [Candidatus Bathyarchaeota archaeon]